MLTARSPIELVYYIQLAEMRDTMMVDQSKASKIGRDNHVDCMWERELDKVYYGQKMGHSVPITNLLAGIPL